MDATNYIKSQVSGWIAEGEDFDSALTTIYVALHDGEPGDDAEENELDPDDGADGYSRYESTVSSDWEETSPGNFQNSNDFVFDEALEEWGEVTHFSLWDGSEDSDNAIGKDSMVSSVNVTEGDAPVFRSGNLSGTFE